MHYYDAQKHWTRRVMPVLGDPELQFVLARGLADYRAARAEDCRARGITTEHWEKAVGLPCEFDSCDWRDCGNWGRGRHGPQPRFWAYVCHQACHYLVDFNLRLAVLVEPDRPWRILNSDGARGGGHSTVWDGGDLLFDLNFLAFGVPPGEAFKLATEENDKDDLCFVPLFPHEYLRGGLVGFPTLDLGRAGSMWQADEEAEPWHFQRASCSCSSWSLGDLAPELRRPAP
jgi:hypothetical protein